jgi:hypothetical protein
VLGPKIAHFENEGAALDAGNEVAAQGAEHLGRGAHDHVALAGGKNAEAQSGHHEREEADAALEYAPIGGDHEPAAEHLNAVYRLAVQPPAAVGRGHDAIGVIGQSAEHGHLVALVHPAAGMLVGPCGGGTDFRRKVLAKEQNPHGDPLELRIMN